MKKIHIIALFIICGYSSLFSQVGINTDGSQADSTAIFDIKSTTKGFLLPRMTADERNAIINPAEGLMIFCTNCGLNGSGVLCVYTDNDWYAFSICKTFSPTPAINEMPPFTIIWKWNRAAGATGYMWNTINSFDGALNMGTDTAKVETGLFCDNTYIRYVWAYDDCGPSAPAVLTQLMTNCWVCSENLTVNHVPGNVAPVNKETTYGTVTNVPGEPTKCWITSNLGSDHQANLRSDSSEASAGWYWQFNRRQGYKYSGTVRTPNTSWIFGISESADWSVTNDPCSLELGDGWRVPTIIEWENVDAAGNWVNWNGPYGSLLKMHAAGRLDSTTGNIEDRGAKGYYWSSTQTAILNTSENLYFYSSSCISSLYQKSYAFSVRCVQD